MADSIELSLPAPRESFAARLWRNRSVRGLLKYPPTVVALVLLAVVLLAAAFGPMVSPFDPNAVQLTDAFEAPTISHGIHGHLLGTDDVGRDVLVRLSVGARVSLLIGGVGATGSALIGIVIGLAAGWLRGVGGAALMRLADLQLAFPFLFFAITVVAVLGASLPTLLVVFSVWSWGRYARISEGLTMSLSQQDFVLAARSLGASPSRILFKHIAPQMVSPMLVLWSFSFASLIVFEASLSFLGLGIRPPTASWGTMLADSQQYLRNAPWLLAAPAITISVTVWCINTIGDRLRDTLDRRLQL